jgi:hypothetical protein
VEVADVLSCEAEDARDNFTDLNLTEMLCSQREFNGLLIPAGARRKPGQADRIVDAVRCRGMDVEYECPFLIPAASGAIGSTRPDKLRLRFAPGTVRGQAGP